MNLNTDNNKVSLTVNPPVEAYFKEIFEIEMLQGTKQMLENGQIHYEFVLSDEKMRILKKWWFDYLKSNVPNSEN